MENYDSSRGEIYFSVFFYLNTPTGNGGSLLATVYGTLIVDGNVLIDRFQRRKHTVLISRASR